MGPYTNPDIKQLALDLIAALTSVVPGAGVGVGGVDTECYTVVINEDALPLANVLSFSVIQSGAVAGYFTHDPLDAAPNRQVIDIDDNLNFGGPINYFSYLKFVAPINCTLTITYILRA